MYELRVGHLQEGERPPIWKSLPSLYELYIELYRKLEDLQSGMLFTFSIWGVWRGNTEKIQKTSAPKGALPSVWIVYRIYREAATAANVAIASTVTAVTSVIAIVTAIITATVYYFYVKGKR